MQSRASNYSFMPTRETTHCGENCPYMPDEVKTVVNKTGNGSTESQFNWDVESFSVLALLSVVDSKIVSCACVKHPVWSCGNEP